MIRAGSSRSVRYSCRMQQEERSEHERRRTQVAGTRRVTRTEGKGKSGALVPFVRAPLVPHCKLGPCLGCTRMKAPAAHEANSGALRDVTAVLAERHEAPIVSTAFATLLADAPRGTLRPRHPEITDSLFMVATP